MNKAILECNGIAAGYVKGLNILQGVDLVVNEGEIVSIIGPNGAGKSTLLKAIMSLIKVSAGRFYLNGTEKTGLSTHKIVMEGLGYVPQVANVFPSLTIEENLEIGSWSIKNKRDALKKIYSDLTPWHKCLIARHPERPHSSKYIEKLMTEFVPLAGDKKFAEDKSIIGGLARLNDTPIVIIGHEKGEDTKSRIQHNFGMARPEGYRKAVRLMDLANRFNLPVITFIDTPGAYPGKGAEERGQAEAIASSIAKCLPKFGEP